MKFFTLCILCLVMFGCVSPVSSNQTNDVSNICSTVKVIKLNDLFDVTETQKVTFIVNKVESNTCWVSNTKEINVQHVPWSSYKIPHSLIALETQAIESVDEKIIWNPDLYPAEPYWPRSWKKDQTLRSAFKHSAHWYYQALVPRIGSENYKKWMTTFNYGNQNTGNGRTDFWLGNILKISPLEQVSFLSCFISSGCGLTANTVDAFESIALNEKKLAYSLFAKTGAGPISLSHIDDSYEGWFVGYIKDDNSKVIATFALYMTAKNYALLKHARKAISLKLLTHLQLWPNH